MRNYWILCLLLLSCKVAEEERAIDVQGHRGARGLAPENSIEGFVLAANMGVTTLELDLVVSKDDQLVVSHEPYFSPDFCLDPFGRAIAADSIINIYELNYNEIQAFDCGSKVHPRFPEQKLIRTSKPMLAAVLDTIESITNQDIYYNIELKTQLATDTLFHPTPEEFSDLTFKLISKKGLWDRVNIQSFDFRTLQYFKKKYPDVKLALLIENELPWKANIDSLGFTPEIYSCYFKLLDRKLVKEIQSAGMKVVPWTINDEREIAEMLEMGVDGVISDYPNRVLKLTKK